LSARAIVMYGTKWCSDCFRAKAFLTRHHIGFTWVDIDADKAGEAYVRQTNRGNRSVPTILFPDGSTLVEPDDAELAKKLNINL